MDEEIKEVGEMATIEDEEEITIEEDYTTLEAETIIIDDDSNIQTDAEYEQAVEQKELADGAREALSAVLLSVLEKGEINDDDIAEIAAQQEIYTENVTALKILGLTTEDEKSTAGKSTTNIVTSNIDYNELIKVLSEKADWLYIDEDGQVMLNGEVVPKIKVIELEAEKIKADVGEFKDLTTENFTAVNAKIDNLEVTDLTAVNADITNLKAQYAEIQTLVNGNLTSDNIQSIVITGDKFTVANGFIKDAMIETLSASKINTGIINTNNVSIQSEDGSMIINGTTQQFKDNSGKVRIQIGKDATGNFTFALFSQDGQGVLIDETGIKSGAVPDGLIVNDMVADNANISGGKLDISSVISSINNNENTLNASKIKFDETEQTLEVAFNQLKTKVETIADGTIDGDLSSVIEQVTTNTTNIQIAQGQINSLISNTTITKEDGTVVQMKDEFNSVKDTVNSHTQTINYHESTLNSVTAKQTKFEQSLDGFKTTVSNTYATKSDLSTTNNNVSNITAKQSELEQSLDGFKTTVSNTYQTKDDMNNYSTTSAMNSAINQKANEITSTVSQTYATQSTTNSMLSQIQQNANSISTKVDVNGVISSINQSSETIAINANKINLNGYVSNDDANWSIDNEGNIRAENLNVEGDLSADSITCNTLNSPKYPGTLDGDIELFVNSSSGNDDAELDDGAVYETVQGAIDALPKFLNGKTAHITMQTNSTEDVYMKGFVGGAVRIYMNRKTLYGTIRTYVCSAAIHVYGGTKDSTEGAIGVIHPNTGLAFAGRAVSMGFEACQYIALYKLKVYAPDTIPSSVTSTDKVCIASQSGTGNVYCKNVQIVNAVVGFRCNNHGSMHVNSSSGIASKYGFQSVTGGMMSLANNSQAGGKTGNTNKNSGGQIWYDTDGVTFATGNQTIESGSAPVVSGTKTITIKSSYGDTYRSSVYNSWKKDGTVRQGDYGYGDCTGCWFFGSAFSELKGKTINKVQITINRQSGGSYAAVGLVVRTHNYSSRPSGSPTLSSSSYGTLSIPTGTSGTLTITNSNVLNGISNGTVKGFGIRTTYDSAHYAVCSGSVTVKITYTE